ncbi:globin family protein [Solimonas soli]|uniref:globin family protein n=1 Tax=Solimonas soli TaxID=413479 RepID=UPI0004B49BE6|nr:globin family protein [Solimonas soli]
MNPSQIAMVQASWQQVLPMRRQAAALFYGRLFSLHPHLRALFHSPIAEQGEKLINMIDAAIGNLDRLDQLMPVIHALGARHQGYGVQPDHYVAVGGALLWTLEQGLGAAFTAELCEAWTEVYSALAAAMLDGASQADGPMPATLAA